MKKFLLSLAAVACACAINAQNGAPLYCTGDFEASNWAPEAPVEFAWDGTNYTYSFDQVSMFKISTAFGDWDTFNEGCVTISGFPEEPGTFELIAGDANITLWKAQWDVVVAGDLSTITLSTETPNPNAGSFATIYIRGGMNGWGVDEAWVMTTTDGKVYTFTTNADNGTIIEPGIEFKFADENWGKYNFSTEGEIMPFADQAEAMENLYGPLAYNGGNSTIAYDANPVVVTFILDVTDLTNVTLACFAGEAGVEALSIDAANAAPVYYNLMGVRVNNPENGVFVKVCGDKASKVLVK